MKKVNRRLFLTSLPAASSVLAGGADQAPLKIRHVDIVHHTHTDVGYTELPFVVRELQKRYLDTAIDACVADAGFRWTVESLVELDDWWKTAPGARRNQFLALVKSGRMDVMGMPFNQTPFLNAMQWTQMMRWIPESLWNACGIRAAMQNDVNGFPRAGAYALLNHGVKHLLMGLNADSGGPPFRRPDAFWWKLPDGRRLFVWHGEHYGSVMRYLQAGRKGDFMQTDEKLVRAAHEGFVKRMREIESEGYGFERLILTFTHPSNYDNGGPVPSLAPFIAAWNRLRLQPSLRLATATSAVLEMEKLVSSRIPEKEGEWTDWWANGDASGPREVAASRIAKRDMAAVMSPLFGPMPARANREVEEILKDLCLFDEHTWGASASISAPYSYNTLAQYVEKSDLAYKPMGRADMLLRRRVRAKVDPLPAGVYVLNATPAPMTGWATIPVNAAGDQARVLVDPKNGERILLTRENNRFRFWVNNLAGQSLRMFEADTSVAPLAAPASRPAVQLDSRGWPVSASWSGMKQPLFDGAMGDFVCVGVIPPADRRTLARLHNKFDEATRKAALRETSAEGAGATSQETPFTVVYSQEFLHPRIANARRTLELWKQEPRARLTVKFDRISSTAPEVLFLAFALPAGVPLPVVSCGGVPFTPYRDQLPGACRDYVAIDGWAHYATANGHWLWVTKDAPLVAIGAPHVVELHQAEPAHTNRMLAMIFDNCWHTNFVADSHGTMEFGFDLVWKENIAEPAALAETLAANPITIVNPPERETPAVENNQFRP